MVNDNIYIFGGQGKGEGIFFNDLYQLKISPVEGGTHHIPKYHAYFNRIKIPEDSPVPTPRTSHSCIPYKNRYLIVIGGENEQFSDDEGDDENNPENPNEEKGADGAQKITDAAKKQDDNLIIQEQSKSLEKAASIG